MKMQLMNIKEFLLSVVITINVKFFKNCSFRAYAILQFSTHEKNITLVMEKRNGN